ncbi:MAG: 3-isopropylmalate dehydratase small subunit [Cyanobacteria bacterium]|nr:3-isopropylmalate dehydratase small subunit [Cyanobacteriota bacterium]
MSSSLPPRPFPAGPIASVTGTAVVVRGDDIDTDRIIPARFLKCVTFEGLAEGAFADDRTELAGAHAFDQAEHQGASLLLVNRNFGCGSSREHAPQALMRWGIRAVVGESFAEIFYGNCLALVLPCLTAGHDAMRALQEAALAAPTAPLCLTLAEATLEGYGQRWPLELPAGPLQMLTTGQWDATGQLLSHHAELSRTLAALPYANGFH